MIQAQNATLTASTNRSATMISKVITALSLTLVAGISSAAICNYAVNTENGLQSLNEVQSVQIKSYLDSLEIEMARLQRIYLSEKADITVLKIIDLHQEKLACISRIDTQSMK